MISIAVAQVLQEFANKAYTITRGADGVHRVDGDGEPVEYAVRMRRLPDAWRADNRLARGELTPGVGHHDAPDAAVAVALRIELDLPVGERGVGVGNGDVGSGDGVGSDCPQAATTSAAAPVAALLRKKRRLSTLRAGVFASLAAVGG